MQRTIEEAEKVAAIVNELQLFLEKKMDEGIDASDVLDAVLVCLGLQAAGQADPEAALQFMSGSMARVCQSSRKLVE